MSIDYTRLRDDIVSKIDTDPDQKYDTDGDGDDEVPKPDVQNAAFDALVHYIAKAVVEELDVHGQIDAGIEVEDSNGNKIGETRESGEGAVS